MRALVLENPGPSLSLVMKEAPTPSPDDGEVLVRVRACGFCHHDLLVMAGVLRRGVNLPLVLGHEVAGQVERVGPGVEAVVPGDRVVCLPTTSCGRCPPCSEGRDHRCLKGQGLGHSVNGGMAQYIKVQESALVKVPSRMPWEEACLLACPMGVGLLAMEAATKVGKGATVVVTGAGGGLGIHLVQMAGLRGARVLAVTSSPEKADSIKSLGAEDVILTGALNFSEVVLALTEDRGADVVLDTVGSPLWPDTLNCLASNGRLVALGEVLGREVRLNLAEVIFRDATIIGSSGVSKKHVEEIVRLVDQGKLRGVIHRVVPWAEAMEAYALLTERKALGRVVLKID